MTLLISALSSCNSRSLSSVNHAILSSSSPITLFCHLRLGMAPLPSLSSREIALCLFCVFRKPPNAPDSRSFIFFSFLLLPLKLIAKLLDLQLEFLIFFVFLTLESHALVVRMPRNDFPPPSSRSSPEVPLSVFWNSEIPNKSCC